MSHAPRMSSNAGTAAEAAAAGAAAGAAEADMLEERMDAVVG